MKQFFTNLQFYAKLGFATGLLILRNRELRRKLMFFVSIAAMLSVFSGGFLFMDFLLAHPWGFVIYWFVSGTLVLGMILLALYDMLRLKGDQASSEREELMGLLAEIEKAATEEAATTEEARSAEGEDRAGGKGGVDAKD